MERAVGPTSPPGSGPASEPEGPLARLRTDDLGRVLRLAGRLVSITDFGELQPALGRLAAVVGSDTGTFTQLDLSSHREVAVGWPGWSVNGTKLQAYARLGSSHPLRSAVSSQRPTRAQPVATSDVLSHRQWREHPLRSEAMPEVTDQLSVLLARSGNAVHAVTLSRHGGTFTAQQKDILSALQPFVATAVKLARRTGHQAMQISSCPVRWVPADCAPGVAAAARPGALENLSNREREVLELVAEGLTDAQAARRLGLAPATVSKHLRRIYARIDVPNRAAAVRLMHR